MHAPYSADTSPRTRTLSRGKSLAVLGGVALAFVGAGYLLYLLAHALAWATGAPAWLAGLLYFVLVLELRVAGEPRPKGLLPAPLRRGLLWAGQALLLVWLWRMEHPAFWGAVGFMVAARVWSWRWRARKQARDPQG